MSPLIKEQCECESFAEIECCARDGDAEPEGARAARATARRDVVLRVWHSLCADCETGGLKIKKQKKYQQ